MSGEHRNLWSGRSLALIGLVLFTVNLRTAVAALSPVYDVIDAELQGGAFGLGLLGMLPPLCFAVFGLITPSLARRFALEELLVGALAVMLAGHLLRGFAWSFGSLLFGSILCFAAIGAGNVIVPAIVKKYFSDRIGQMTAVYTTVMSIATFVPPLVAVPMARAVSWQFSLGMWGLLVVFAIVPWGVQSVLNRRAVRGDPGIAELKDRAAKRIARSRTAWALTLTFAASSSVAYTSFAWLPQILTDVADVSPAAGGALLSLFGFFGLPAAIVMPPLATRVKRPAVLVWLGAVFILAGVIGLLTAPHAVTWLWVSLLGSGPLLFPLALTLINLRSRTQQTVIAVSGFVQGSGYIIAAAFPLLVGALHELSGGWTLPLIVLGLVALPTLWAGRVIGARRMIDDETAA
ncbi:MFS transporter [Paramicrobacterium agarici]|uniref:CP family cyanate transporter-like MFS transporter n=1 Tax=Paramicrobacterium agarici TaxID=630514 RepID=A0A2A9DWK7_9MICO|nr:MFS transporter [Microbacterium agarici]PFG30983.1 CP family cyanate transporter-like MFS transporter [Microbacterium agarici]